MKKLLSIFTAFLFVCPLLLTFTACSDDDDDKGSGSGSRSLIGTWRSDVGMDDFDEVIVRFYDGDYYLGTARKGRYEMDFDGDYTLSGSTLKITRSYCSGTLHNYYPPFEEGERYKVSISGNKLKLTEITGDYTYHFVRASNSYLDYDDDDYYDDDWY